MISYVILAVLGVIQVVVYFLIPEPQTALQTFFLCFPLIVGTGVFMVRALINEWYYDKKPIRLKDVEQEYLNKHCAYYRNLNQELKEVFEKRLFNFRLQKVFEVHGPDDVPEDVKLLVSATAVQFTMGFEDYIYPKLAVIVLFPRNFISPDMPTTVHAVEHKIEDWDCVIMSMEALMYGMFKPKDHYNAGLHIMAKAWQVHSEIKDTDIPINEYGNLEDFIKLFVKARGFVRLDFQEYYTGLKQFELFPACVELYFSAPQAFRTQMPNLFTWVKETIQQDMTDPSCPVPQSFSELESN